MDTAKRKEHWENVFQTKDTSKVSWHQPAPTTSLQLIDTLKLNKSDKIIEVGCGDSFLADRLLQKGYSEITLLDIADKALETIKIRLGDDAKKINFISADITNFQFDIKYRLWHDRAVFHFLIEERDIQKYVLNVSSCIVSGGFLIISTFSKNGPDMCSDLSVQQYSEKEMVDTFNNYFTKIECFTENHIAPSGSIQNFLFCIFQRK
jgi:ubiquinone/menaquinone biosynthesis C-methylase UbiE